MGEYHDKREELKGFLTIHMIRVAEAEGTITTPAVNQMFRDQAALLLDQYEPLAVSHHYGKKDFWRGVGQSFIGSLFFALFLGILWIIKMGGTEDPSKLISGKTPVNPAAAQGSVSH